MCPCYIRMPCRFCFHNWNQWHSNLLQWTGEATKSETTEYLNIKAAQHITKPTKVPQGLETSYITDKVRLPKCDCDGLLYTISTGDCVGLLYTISTGDYVGLLYTISTGDCVGLLYTISTGDCVGLLYTISTGDDYDGEYETAAHQAAAEGDSQLLVTAVKQDPGSIQQRDNEGMTRAKCLF